MNELLTKEFLQREYVDNKKSFTTISNEFKISRTSIYSAMLKLGVPIRKSKKFQIPRDMLYIEYVENEKTMKEISDMFGCSFNVIQSLMSKYGIEARVGRNDLVCILPEELLRKLYVEDELNIREISIKLNISERYVSNKLKQFQIPRKRAIKKDLQVDLVNQIFGKLIVKQFDGINNAGEWVWLCECKCGNKIKVGAAALLGSKATKSCGCTRRKNSDWKIIPPYIWNNLSKKAEARGLIWGISREYAENIFEKQNNCCALSGIPLIFARRRDTQNTTASLDRIDSNYGYIEGNVQWTHKHINSMKLIHSQTYFIELCKAVAEFNK
jgi:predicted DNA-binding protein YlxM (UPF0122 family)